MAARIVTGRLVLLLGVSLVWPLIPSTPSHAGTIRGTVVDRDGKPAAGAKVWAAKSAFREPRQIRDATADDHGSFSVEASPGPWAVRALRGREGSRAEWTTVPEDDDGKPVEPVTVTLGPPTNLKGRLLDAETGEPIREGLVSVNDARQVEVLPDGRFEAPGLEMADHTAYPICPGYESFPLVFDTTLRPDAELEVKLKKGGSIIGRVLDPDGKPVPGAVVGASTSGSSFGPAVWLPCDPDGKFVLGNRALGKIAMVTAHAPGYQDNEHQEVLVRDAEHPAELDLILVPGLTEPAVSRGGAAPAEGSRTVSGKVVAGGRPVAGAIVRWGMIVGSDPVPEVKTDVEGRFTLAAMPDATNVLSVFAKGFQPRFPLVDGKGDQTMEIELKPGATIRGRIVDDEGKPIAGARVVPLVDHPQSEWGTFRPFWQNFVYLYGLECVTGDDGTFTLEGMPEGVKADIIAEGLSDVSRRELSPTDPTKNVIALSGEGAIRGRVVDFFGNPVRNFRIKLGFPEEKKPGDVYSGFSSGMMRPGVTFTRDDGVFTISELTAGNVVRLTAVTDGVNSGEVDRVVVDSINHLKPAADLTISLAPPHLLRVRVVRVGAKPLEGAEVTVIGAEFTPRYRWNDDRNTEDARVTATTDAEGWASFNSLPFTKGTVLAQATGFARIRLPWRNAEPEVLAILQPESTLSGKVTDAAGRLPDGIRVVLSWGGESAILLVDGKDGRYSCDGLAPGNYRVNVVTKRGVSLQSEPITLKPGEALTRDITITEPAPKAR